MLGTLKPLVPVSGQPLISRVLSSIAEAAPAEVSIIINEESLDVRTAIDAAAWPFDLRWIVETTPSSMHSFLRIVDTLARDDDEGPFLVSTVDTVAGAGVYGAFASAALAIEADVVLAVNAPQPDDKPLLVRVEGPAEAGHYVSNGRHIGDAGRHVGRVTAIGDGARSGQGRLLATAGFYMVSPSVLREADAAQADGLTALRLFLGRLLTRGYRIAAIEVADSIDVDRPGDVAAAESFLRSVHA